MKNKRLILYLLGLLILFSGLFACNAEKEVAERRNLMMPRTSEMRRNDRYKEPDKRKTNKVKLTKSKRKSLY